MPPLFKGGATGRSGGDVVDVAVIVAVDVAVIVVVDVAVIVAVKKITTSFKNFWNF